VSDPIERVAQGATFNNGSGSTGPSWGPGVVQAGDAGRFMVACIFHENVGLWTAEWRPTGSAGGEMFTRIQDYTLPVTSHRLTVLVLDDPAPATAAGANVHVGGPSCRFAVVRQYWRNVGTWRNVWEAGSAEQAQADPKRVGLGGPGATGAPHAATDRLVAFLGSIGLRNATPEADEAVWDDEGNVQQNGTGTDTTLDWSGRRGGPPVTFAGWDTAAAHHWAAAVLALRSMPDLEVQPDNGRVVHRLRRIGARSPIRLRRV
jgi:hypothetical protein